MNEQVIKYLLMIVSILGSIAAYTAAHRLFSSPPEDSASDLTKLAKREAGTTTAFSSLNPQGSMLERLDIFLLRTFHLDVKLEELHMMMGRPAKPTPLEMLHLKEMIAGGMAVMLWYITDSFVVGAFGLAGFFIPDKIFQGKIEARQVEIMRTFPTFVDLAALTIEAGLDYMAAIERILKNAKKHSELEVELGKMVNEVQLGYTRRDALKRLALRTGITEIRSFVGLIIQSDELGTSLVDLLRNYSTDMRFRRLNKAEKLAAQASTKMLFPLFMFIFPTVFIMMLGPMIKSLMSGGLGF